MRLSDHLDVVQTSRISFAEPLRQEAWPDTTAAPDCADAPDGPPRTTDRSTAAPNIDAAPPAGSQCCSGIAQQPCNGDVGRAREQSAARGQHNDVANRLRSCGRDTNGRPPQCACADDSAAPKTHDSSQLGHAPGRSAPVSDQGAQQSDARAVGALQWREAPGASAEQQQPAYLWVGPSEGSAALTELLMTLSGATWGFFDPTTATSAFGVPAEMNRRLMRRFYLLEKAREAALVGILVGTLALPRLSHAVGVLRGLAKRAGKRTHTVLMGKPNPGKLANFPEVRVSHAVAAFAAVWMPPVYTLVLRSARTAFAAGCYESPERSSPGRCTEW